MLGGRGVTVVKKVRFDIVGGVAVGSDAWLRLRERSDGEVD